MATKMRSRNICMLMLSCQLLYVYGFLAPSKHIPALRQNAVHRFCNVRPQIPSKTANRGATNYRTTKPIQMGFFDMFSNGTISRLADEADSEEINDLVSDISLALLRRESDWLSAAMETVKTSDENKADDAFSQMSLKERAKVERETVNVVGGVDKSEARAAEGKLEDIGKSTVAVVTLIVALQGKTLPPVKDNGSLKEALSTLASEALNPDSLLAAEIMWTPEEAYDSLLPEEVALEFPTLIPL